MAVVDKKTPEKKGLDTGSFKWPPLFDLVEVQFLSRRIAEAASTEDERLQFETILQIARREVLEVEALYNELPGVFENNQGAIENFLGIIDRAMEVQTLDDDAASSHQENDRLFMSDDLDEADLATGRPLVSIPFLRPEMVFLLAQGIAKLSQGNELLHDRRMRALIELCRRFGLLDFINSQALMGGSLGGEDRLALGMRIMARDLGIPVLPIPKKFKEPPPPWTRTLAGVTYTLSKQTQRCLEIAAGIPPLPQVVSVKGIKSLDQHSVCPGGSLTIMGVGFGLEGDLQVLIGAQIVPVVSQSDKKIVVSIPPGTSSGLVGFLYPLRVAERDRILADSGGMIEDALENSGCFAHDHGLEIFIPGTLSWQDIPPDIGVNYVHIGPPNIWFFRVNGSSETVTVKPGEKLTLDWLVLDATTIRVYRVSLVGPDIAFAWDSNENQNYGDTIELPPFAENFYATAHYELIAWNQCGPSSVMIAVNLSETPQISILGVEFTQAVQRFTLADHVDIPPLPPIPASNWNNSIKLVAHKRTMARVYVDSGLRSGFNGNQVGIQGTLTVKGWGSVPLNPQTFRARPIGDTQRENAGWLDRPEHSLNFELPINAVFDRAQIAVHVWVRGHEHDPDPGWHYYHYSTFDFHPRNDVHLQPLLFEDTKLPAPMPTFTQYLQSLRGAQLRYPIAAWGFVVRQPLTFKTGVDLKTTMGWMTLLLDIQLQYLMTGQSGDIWTALIPNRAVYNSSGALGLASAVTPCFMVRAGWPVAFAHETGHTFSIGHAPCPNSGSRAPSGVDSRLPGRTDELGVNVDGNRLVPRGTGELMSYCGEETRWMSTALWQILFDKFV